MLSPTMETHRRAELVLVWKKWVSIHSVQDHSQFARGVSPRAGVQEGTPEAPALPRSQSALHFLKQDSGPVGLESVIQQTKKLEHIHQLSLPADLLVSSE